MYSFCIIVKSNKYIFISIFKNKLINIKIKFKSITHSVLFKLKVLLFILIGYYYDEIMVK